MNVNPKTARVETEIAVEFDDLRWEPNLVVRLDTDDGGVQLYRADADGGPEIDLEPDEAILIGEALARYGRQSLDSGAWQG